MLYAIIDIEATGGSPRRDKITEIAIYLFDGEKIIDTFVSLINPGIGIPPFITRLTGITNRMVANAPTFSEVVAQIDAITEGAIFVAHNVQFDYAYIKAEFRHLGLRYERKKMCTVQLSKLILPNMASYSLGNLCEDLGIILENRHRAPGDARATVELFKILQKNDVNKYIDKALDDSDIYNNLPPGLSANTIDVLPEETGVFYLHNEIDKVIFVGKSGDIKQRVFQYLNHGIANNGNSKAWKMMYNTHHISYQETGSDLIAQLLENFEIKRLKPAYNRAKRARNFRFGIYKDYNSEGYLELKIEKFKLNTTNCIAAYSKLDYAENALKLRIEKYNLCENLCGSKKQNNDDDISCLNYQLKMCKGACIGVERVSNYNRRARASIKDLQYPFANFLIIGEGRNMDEKSVVYIESYTFIGLGYVNAEQTQNISYIKEKIEVYTESPDITKIIIAYLKKNKLDDIIKF